MPVTLRFITVACENCGRTFIATEEDLRDETDERKQDHFFVYRETDGPELTGAFEWNHICEGGPVSGCAILRMPEEPVPKFKINHLQAAVLESSIDRILKYGAKKRHRREHDQDPGGKD